MTLILHTPIRDIYLDMKEDKFVSDAYKYIDNSCILVYADKELNRNDEWSNIGVSSDDIVFVMEGCKSCNTHEIAASRGHIRCFEELEDAYDYYKNNICKAATKNGHIEFLRHINNCGYKLSSVIATSAKYGQFECLKYAINSGYEITTSAISTASKHGQLDCLILMVEHANNNRMKSSVMPCSTAASGGHLDCLSYLISKGFSISNSDNTLSLISTISPSICAAKCGHLHILKYMYEIEQRFHPKVKYHAAKYGNFECLKFIHEHSSNWDSNICNITCDRGFFNCFKYAIENGCPMQNQKCLSMSAARKFTLEQFEYFHDIGINYHEEETYVAAEHGRLNILMYLRDNRCPLHKCAGIIARNNGHTGCLQFILNWTRI